MLSELYHIPTKQINTNTYPRTLSFSARIFLMQKSITKEVKKCFSKPTEKAVKKRGISLSKHWICAYKSHLLGVFRLPARSVLLNAKCIQRSPPETRTPKTHKKSRTLKGMRQYIKTVKLNTKLYFKQKN